MKTILLSLLIAFPAAAHGESRTEVPELIPMELESQSFEVEAETAYQKLKRMLRESRHARCVRNITLAIARRDHEAAQKALDELVAEYPESVRNEPNAIRYHQGSIYFWRKDFENAYKEMDTVVGYLEHKYPKGIPAGGKYSEINAMFMSDAYFARGAAAMQMSRFAQAAGDFEKAFRLAPKAYIPLNLCRALLRLGKRKEATEAYDQAYSMHAPTAENAEDRGYICGMLAKNDPLPKACVRSGSGAVK
ncbi:MAG TPA: hypothetical protein PK523_00165 [Elusimicrobiales bacterium]|nr:hypothetical protein [Elusimicrobiales bacterium]